MRVLINGFGRIGRSVLRAWLQDRAKWPGLEIVAVNDIASSQMCAYLFEFDSVFGPWKGIVALGDAGLDVDGHVLALTQASDLSTLNLAGIDLVLECTGRADTAEVASRGLRAGAGRVAATRECPPATRWPWG